MILGPRIHLTIAVALALVCAGAPSSSSGAQTKTMTTLEEVMGVDDGYGISIQTAADVTGNIEPCGCKVPLGGIPRRIGYAKALEAQTGGKAVVLQLDAGRMFSRDTTPGLVLVDDFAVKNEWLLRAAEAVNLRAVNVTAYDLAALAPYTASNGYESRAKQHPALDRLVSANVVPTDAKMHAFKPYVIEEVTSPRFGAKPVRVGILGVTEVPTAGPSVEGYTIGDPIAAIKKYAPEVRSRSDVFLILAYVDMTTLRGIEPVAPGIDAVVAAHQHATRKFDGPVDAPATVYAPNQGRSISELRFYPAPEGQPKRYSKMAARYIAISPLIPEEPAALQFTRDALKAYRKV